MAHMLDMSNGRANMAYVGETPWHGLGRALTKGQPIEIWAKEAGMNFNIEKSPLHFNANGESSLFPARVALYRSDNGAPLSIMGEDYKIVQPEQVLEFYRDLVDAAGFELETAGVLYSGRRYWALAKTGDQMRLLGQDEVRGYLLLATSCDGSLATTAKFTSVRVVCQNTLSAATGDYNKGGAKVPHNTVFDADRVKRELGVVHEAWAEFARNVEVLAARKVTQKEAVQWLVKTFGDADKPVDEQDEAAARFMQKIWDCVRNSPGSNLRSANGTAWGLVNGATYYYDHMRSTRSLDARFDRGQFGDGAAKKELAFTNALELAA